MRSAVPLRANQLGALHTLCWMPWLLRCCTLCGMPVPLAPVPRCPGVGARRSPMRGPGNAATGRHSEPLSSPGRCVTAMCAGRIVKRIGAGWIAN